MAIVPVRRMCARQNLVSSGAFLFPSYSIGLQRNFLLRSPRARGCIVS